MRARAPPARPRARPPRPSRAPRLRLTVRSAHTAPNCRRAAPRCAAPAHPPSAAAAGAPRAAAAAAPRRAARTISAAVRPAAAAAAAPAPPRPLRVMIAGAPAAGKGTQCERIVERYGLVHISVGDLLRAEVAAGSAAGLKAQAFMDAGDLVPNEVVVEMVLARVGAPDAAARGWLLDGYPRSGEQAEAIEAAGIRPDVFLLVNVPDEALVERVVGRRLDPETGAIYHLAFKPPPPEVAGRLVQRSDDTEEKCRHRLATFHRHVGAVLGFYPGRVVEVDGARPMGEVFDQVAAALDAAAAAAPQAAAA